VQAVESVILYCYQGFLDEKTLRGNRAALILELADCLGMEDLKGAVEMSLVNTVSAVQWVESEDETPAKRVGF
jgi:hypothetical protein